MIAAFMCVIDVAWKWLDLVSDVHGKPSTSSDVTTVLVRCHVLFVLIGVPCCLKRSNDEVSVDNLSKVELWIVGFVEEFGQTCDRGQFGG